MKNAKQRVIAIDYFRGICILVVLLSHSSVFSTPLNYLTGGNHLWTSAAEMFFLLSGLTLGVVRGDKLAVDFRGVATKMWRRAGMLYLINTMLVLCSLCLALWLGARGLTVDIPGSVLSSSPLRTMAGILSFSYSLGWANFLMYYAVFMLFAPFALYAVRSRFWLSVPALSIVVFAAGQFWLSGSPYQGFALWQIYFCMGLILYRLRGPVIGWLYGLNQRSFRWLFRLVMAPAACSLVASSALSGLGQHAVNSLSAQGWLPAKLQAAYQSLLSHSQVINQLLLNNRSGVLRPLASMIFLAAAYLLYQRYKGVILNNTGNFVNALGKDTLWIFSAQALIIPILAALPIQRNLFNNSLLTASLISMMWLLTKRRIARHALVNYWTELRTAYTEAKYAYIYNSENNLD